MSDMLSEALEYANRGWFVFPCREKPGKPFLRGTETISPLEKTPYVTNGLNDATRDEDQIKAWWTKWPNALIGVNAGKSGLFVIDIDKKHVNGLDTFTQWEINDSAGLHSMTPSGGMHIIFTGKGKSSTNAKTGIDTRGDGGYFIAPPSKIFEGEYTGEYKQFDDWSKSPGVIPDGLMGKLFPDKTTEYVRGSSTFTEGAMKQLSRNSLNFLVSGAEPGERNSTLFKVLADFCGCGFTQEHAREVLMPVCVRIGLGKDEFETVLRKAYSRPRTPSVPDSIQEKIVESKKKAASKITSEEQAKMEEALLACLISNNSFIPTVNDIISFEDFRILKNRIIFRAINRVFNSGLKVDYLILSDELSKETNKISLDSISRMMREYLLSSENVIDYARIIREKSSVMKLETILDNKSKYMNGPLIEIVNNLEKDISEVALYGGAKSTNILTAKQAVDMVAEHTKKMATGEIKQLNTGFLEYDYHVGGLFSNELVVCAAHSGEGKSAFALSMAKHMALESNRGVGFFTLEMSTRETVCRLISQLTGLKFRNVFQGKLSNDEWKVYTEAAERISKSPIYFDDGYGMTVSEIRLKIRKLMEKDVSLIILDQLEQIKGYDGLPPYQQFNRIAYDIKDMTKEFEIPILLNHQLNRGMTDRKLKNPTPQLSDLNQAGEKPADQVWYILHRKDERGTILQSKIKLMKNRNGPKIEFAVIFLGERMLFSNPTREEDKHAFQNNFVNGDDRDDDNEVIPF